MTTETATDEPKSYTCDCGKEHNFSLYVYAHWDLKITHKCECGLRNELRRGRVISSADEGEEGDE